MITTRELRFRLTCILHAPITPWFPHNMARRFASLAALMVRMDRECLWHESAVRAMAERWRTLRPYGRWRARPKPKARKQTPEELARLEANLQAILKRRGIR